MYPVMYIEPSVRQKKKCKLLVMLTYPSKCMCKISNKTGNIKTISPLSYLNKYIWRFHKKKNLSLITKYLNINLQSKRYMNISVHLQNYSLGS